MPRPTGTPEASPKAQLATEAHRVGVLAFFSETAKAQGLPHVRLFARGGNVTELPSIEEAREWLRLQARRD